MILFYRKIQLYSKPGSPDFFLVWVMEFSITSSYLGKRKAFPIILADQS